MGASTSQNPMGLQDLLQGKFYLDIYNKTILQISTKFDGWRFETRYISGFNYLGILIEDGIFMFTRFVMGWDSNIYRRRLTGILGSLSNTDGHNHKLQSAYISVYAQIL
jgi:hypothetical protein